jgi:hypothetical protein
MTDDTDKVWGVVPCPAMSSYSSWGCGVIPVLCTYCMPSLVINGCEYGSEVRLSVVWEDMSWGISEMVSLLICVTSPGACGLL